MRNNFISLFLFFIVTFLWEAWLALSSMNALHFVGWLSLRLIRPEWVWFLAKIPRLRAVIMRNAECLDTALSRGCYGFYEWWVEESSAERMLVPYVDLYSNDSEKRTCKTQGRMKQPVQINRTKTVRKNRDHTNQPTPINREPARTIPSGPSALK